MATAVIASLCLSLAACGSGSSESATATAATIAKKHPTVSPDLRISIDPTSGRPGTVVAVTVTGCNDLSRLNHAVSFNNNAEDVGARNDPARVREIPTVQHGETLTGTYTLREADRTGGIGAFFAQCGATLKKTAVFKVLASSA
jgi:hypothetical protein